MDYFQLSFRTDKKNREPLIALLAEIQFDAFQETETGFDTWIPEVEYDTVKEKDINNLQNLFSFSFEKKIIKHQNWNALWEADFHPIVVNDFCGIRATFHQPIENVQHEIIIDPKMAFGTGHHETTFMVMQAMRNLNFKNTKVLDYGCGTGILAILAAKLGSLEIVGVDIEAPAVENTIDNLHINQISGVKVLEGTLDQVKDGDYDIILANINRNVILATLPSLYLKLKQGGTLLVSGFIKEDANLLQENAESAGFIYQDKWQRNNWISMAFTR